MKVKQKTKKAMLNNNFNVETIVNKYRNFVKKNSWWPKDEWDYDAFDDKTVDSEIQLLTRLSHDHKDGASVYQKALDDEFLKYFRKDAISKEEYRFLLENYLEAVNFIFSCYKDWAVKSSRYWSSVPDWAEDFMIRNGVKDNDTVMIYEPGINGHSYPKCHYVMYTEEDNVAKALMFLKYSAIGATVRFTQDPAEDEKLMDKVDFIVCPFSARNLEEVPQMFKKANDKCKFLIFLGYKLCEALWLGSCEKKSALHFNINSVLYIKNAPSSRLLDQRFAITMQKGDVSKVDMGIANISNDNIQIIEAGSIPQERLHSGSMHPAYYLSVRPGDVPLSSFLSIVKGSQIQSEEIINKFLRKYGEDGAEHFDELEDRLKSESPIQIGMPMLLTKDLSAEFASASISSNSLSVFSKNDKKGEFYLVKEPCIALCSTGNQLVAGYIKEVPENGIAVTKNIVCLNPKQELTLETGTALLLTDSIRNEIEALGVGNDPISWSTDLLDMVMIPDLKDIMPSLNKVLTDTVAKQQAEIKSQYEAYQKTIHMRKHALSQNVSSLSSVFNTLDTWRNKNYGVINDADVISRVSGTTVGEAFENIKNQIRDIREKVSKIAEPTKSFGEPEEIEPESFVEDFIKANKQNWLNFKSRAVWEEDEEWEWMGGNKKESNSLYFSRKALTHILNNIVANACSHGFTDPSRSDYELCFSWKDEGLDLALEVSNNGTPIPEGLDDDLLKTYGFSTKLNHAGHNGAGCAEIEELMRKYGGRFEIKSTPKGKYTVIYILTFKRVSHFEAI